MQHRSLYKRWNENFEAEEEETKLASSRLDELSVKSFFERQGDSENWFSDYAHEWHIGGENVRNQQILGKKCALTG